MHTAQLMPLPLTVSCFSKIQIGFTCLVPAHLGSPGKRAVKQVCVCTTYFVFQVNLVSQLAIVFLPPIVANSFWEIKGIPGVLLASVFISQLTVSEAQTHHFFVHQWTVQGRGNCMTAVHST